MVNHTNSFFNKGFIKTLNFILVALVGISVSLGSYIYFSQNYSGTNEKDAQAALNCPVGTSPSPIGCQPRSAKNAAYYSCQNATDILSGSQCTSSSTKTNNTLHISQCAAGASILTRIAVDNNPNYVNTCDVGRTDIENTTLNIANNRYLGYQFCENITGPDVVTRFNAGGTNPMPNPCDSDLGRRPIPLSGEGTHTEDLYLNQYMHISYCQANGDANNVITRVVLDNDPNTRDICNNDPQRTQIEQPLVFDVGWVNYTATLNPAACPTSFPTDTIDGSTTPCAGAVDNTGATYTIDINTGISACTPSANNLNSGVTFNCTFNLSGSPIGSYTIPSEGLYAGIRNVSGDVNTYLTNSTLCTVAGTVLTCNNIPTAGATVGGKEIVLHQPGVNWYPNKGTINIASVSTPLSPTDIPSLTVTCGASGVGSGVGSGVVNSTTTCSFPMPPNKTLPTDFKISIGTGAINQLNCNNTTTPNTPGCNSANTAVAQACTLTSGTVTCNNIPTGNSIGNIVIYGQFTGTAGSKTPTGETVNIVGLNFGGITWTFTPNQGGTAPLFRNTDDTTININNFKTILDPTPTSNTRYTCNLEYRKINDRLATTTPTWTTISTTPTPYTTGNTTNSGCSFTLTKAMRLNNLNYSLRLTITDTTITNPNTTTNPNTYTFYNEYIYRFQGAGVASGG